MTTETTRWHFWNYPTSEYRNCISGQPQEPREPGDANFKHYPWLKLRSISASIPGLAEGNRLGKIRKKNFRDIASKCFTVSRHIWSTLPRSSSPPFAHGSRGETPSQPSWVLLSPWDFNSRISMHWYYPTTNHHWNAFVGALLVIPYGFDDPQARETT